MRMYVCNSLRTGEGYLPWLQLVLALFGVVSHALSVYQVLGVMCVLQACAHTLSTPCMSRLAERDVGGLMSWLILSFLMGSSSCVHVTEGHGWLHKKGIKWLLVSWIGLFKKTSQKVWQCKQQRCAGQETGESKVSSLCNWKDTVEIKNLGRPHLIG